MSFIVFQLSKVVIGSVQTCIFSFSTYYSNYDCELLPDLFQNWQPLHLRTAEVSAVLLYLDQALEGLLLALLPSWSQMEYLKSDKDIINI